MKRHSLFTLFFMIAAFGMAQSDKERFTQLAQSINRQFQQHHFDSLEMQFDTTMRRGLSAESLEQTLIGLESVYGEMGEFKTPVVESIGANWVARTPVVFPKQLMVLSITFNGATTNCRTFCNTSNR